MEFSMGMAVPLLVALGVLSVLCAVAEAALFSLSRWQVRQLHQAGPGGARVARLLERPEESLAVLSLVNTVANGLVVVVVLRLAVLREWRLDAALILAFLAVLVVGEILPKTVAVRAPERWAVRTAPAVVLLQRLAGPLRRLARRSLDVILGWFVPASSRPAPITDEEYRELLEMAVQQGALAHAEREIIAELITLDRKCARDVMRPRATMAAVADDLTPPELAAAARKWRHRRLPLYDESPDTIVGVLDCQKLLLDPDHRLDEAVEFPSFVPETMNLLKLFHALQRQKRSLAVVLDEFGAVAGIVRMEDILAEVLGEMSMDGPPRGFVLERLGPGRWRVSGAVRLDDFRREYPALPEGADVETLGGLLMAQLDIVPQKGQTATVHGLRLTATVVDERRVHELLVETGGAR
jgi:CBS domain containing-hemolysin-like protein